MHNGQAPTRVKCSGGPKPFWETTLELTSSTAQSAGEHKANTKYEGRKKMSTRERTRRKKKKEERGRKRKRQREKKKAQAAQTCFCFRVPTGRTVDTKPLQRSHWNRPCSDSCLQRLKTLKGCSVTFRSCSYIDTLVYCMYMTCI